MPDRDFFVLYLPVPPALKRQLRALVLGLVLALPPLGAVLAMAQRTPGPAVWADHTEVFEGYVVADPYPRLLVPDGRGFVSMALVEQGKIGGAARATQMVGAWVRATGLTLTRDGHRMLELSPGTTGLAEFDPPAANPGTLPPEQRVIAGEDVVVTGELLDSKCFLGAMKPGDGKAHKACATLCVRGGIPPAFIVRGGTHDGRFLWVSGPDGERMPEDLERFIGEPVEASGHLERHAGADRLVLSPGSVRRR